MVYEAKVFVHFIALEAIVGFRNLERILKPAGVLFPHGFPVLVQQVPCCLTDLAVTYEYSSTSVTLDYVYHKNPLGFMIQPKPQVMEEIIYQNSRKILGELMHW